MVKTHAEMKRRLIAGDKFVMTASIHDGFIGQVRVPNIIGKSHIYSVIDGDPDHKVSTMNGGKGCYMQFGKAGDWKYEDGECKCFNRLGEVLFAFKFLNDSDNDSADDDRQCSFEDVFSEPEEKTAEPVCSSRLSQVGRGRVITIERVEPELWAISTECHDAYLYSGKTIEEAIANYEDDRNCTVAEWHIYERSN